MISRRLYASTKSVNIFRKGLYSSSSSSSSVPSAYRIYKHTNKDYKNEKSFRGTKNPLIHKKDFKDSSFSKPKEVRRLQDDIRNLGRLENEAKSILKLYATALFPAIERLGQTNHNHFTAQGVENRKDHTTVSRTFNDYYNGIQTSHHDLHFLHSTPQTSSSSSSSSTSTLQKNNSIHELLTYEQLHTLSVSLRQSEDKYRHLCVKIRQLVAGWASLRPTSTTDLSTKYHKMSDLSQLFQHFILSEEEGEETIPLLEAFNPGGRSLHSSHVIEDDIQPYINSAKRAEDYIALLEKLRIHRASMVQLALSEYYTHHPIGNDSSHKSMSTKDSTSSSLSKGIMKWIKTLFTSSPNIYDYPNPSSDASVHATSDDPSTRILANLEGLKAHESSNFTSTARLYKEIMKSYIHWHSLVTHEMRNRKTSNYSSHGDNHFDDDEEEEMKHNDYGRQEFEEDRISKMTAEQNQILADELDRLFQSVKHIYLEKKNKNVLPDRDMYHIIMRQHARLGTYTGALRVMELLQEMKEAANNLTNNPSNHIMMEHSMENDSVPPTTDNDKPIRKIRHGKSRLDKAQDSTSEINPLDTYKPTLPSYCIALRACRNFVACPPADNIDRKLKIVDQSINLLHESEAISSAKVWTDGEDLIGNEADSYIAPNLGSVGVEPLDPTWSSRTITFSILNLAGHKVVPDLCSRVDALMIQFIGEGAFLKLIGEDDSASVSDIKEVDLAICHLMIEIYNRKKDKRYANRAKAILRYMEAMVKDSKWNSNSIFPCTNTYNSVIKCMHLERTIVNAEAANELLDSMVRRQYSMPNRTTFNGILSLWSCSDSAEAGEKASAILARMELHDVLQTDSSVRPTVRSYELALKCWSLASSKGYPSAAKRAYGLLKTMEAQCSKVVLKEPLGGSIFRENFMQPYNNELRPEPSIYSYVIYAASKTISEDDKSEAFQIAFDVYNKLIDRKLLPTKMMFLNLINCCHLVPETRSDQRKLLLNRISQSMSVELRNDKDMSQAMRVFQY